MKKIGQCFGALFFLLAVFASAAEHKGEGEGVRVRSGTSLKDMAITSVKLSLEEVKKLSIVASLLSSDNESKRAAIQDCEMLFKYTVRQLNESLNLLTTSVEWKKEQAEDVQTWLSASLTDQVTCIEGFKDLKDNYVESVRNVSKVVSNSLAIVNSFPVANISHGQNNRRLLSEAEDSELYFPSWMSPTDRRLLQSSPEGGMTANAVVAKDGTGNYKSISEAVKAAPSKSTSRYIIHVKAGVYAESVEVSKDNIMLVGDGKYATVVTGSKHGGSLQSLATFAATGKGFVARDMGFENTAGADAGPAIALRVSSDQSAFYRCSVKGYQDSLYAYSQRQFYRECDISGTVDFIFGDASAVFQSCNILSRKRGGGNSNFITAQGRSDPNQNTGFSIQDCQVSAESIRTFLGRPWREYSRTVFMQSSLDGNIDPAGWSEWSGSFALKTLYFAEYMNSGAGAGTAKRVQWPGYHIISTEAEASKFTVAEFISGNVWLPSTGVAFQSGLVVP
uniref:Pectinesterase n=1 Tax=Cunninghamia lanceolata TaxID=28977 RepID=A0A6G9W456_CUNLA|nr:pectin methylesterase 5 [Cunninghamia lanceolata]